MKIYFVSQNEFETGVRYLLNILPRDKYKKLVIVCNGGKTLGNLLKTHLNIDKVDFIYVNNYKNEKLIGDKSIKVVEENVLVVDDILDTGTTLKDVEVDVCVWCIKKRDKYKCEKIKNLFYYKEFDEDVWVVFPWER